MAHMTVRNQPCGLPDGHGGHHRTEAGMENYRASQLRYRTSEAGRAVNRRYAATEKGKAMRAAWNRSHPVQTALAELRYHTRRASA